MCHTAIATTLTVFFFSSATEMREDTQEEKCNSKEHSLPTSKRKNYQHDITTHKDESQEHLQAWPKAWIRKTVYADGVLPLHTFLNNGVQLYTKARLKLEAHSKTRSTFKDI